jgi:hypothetical protein
MQLQRPFLAAIASAIASKGVMPIPPANSRWRPASGGKMVARRRNGEPIAGFELLVQIA